MDSYTRHQMRSFRPIVLFNQDPYSFQTNSSFYPSYQVNEDYLALHKQKVNVMLETNSKLWSDLIDSTKQWEDKNSTLPPIQLPPIQVSLPSFFDHSHSHSHSHSSSHHPHPHHPHSYNEPMMSPSSPTSPTLSSSLTTPTSITFNNNPLKDIQQPQPQPQQPITLSTSTSTSSTTSSSSSSTSSLSSPIISKIHMETLCLDHFDKPRRGNLPKPVTAILKRWLIEHCRNPYPTEEEKQQLKRETQLTLNQISNWFINARRRTLPIILAKLNQQYPGIKARRRRRKRSDKTMNNND
ncbi:unnamed protein product [Cunninghamella echinulata]